MKKYSFRRMIAMLVIISALAAAGAACAQSVTFNGSIQPSEKHTVFMPIGGIVEKVLVKPGDEVTEDTPIARLKTDKVYASEDGEITAVFGQPGDDAETVAARYGEIICMEGSVKYIIKAGTRTAHRSTETQYVHAGEKVYLISLNHNGYTGEGYVTNVKGNDFTVQVTDGEFLLDETIAIYRDPERKSVSKLGSGVIARNTPTAITGKGGIVAIHVKPGDSVKRGDLLLETLDGDFDGLYMTGPEIKAGVDGTVGEIKLTEGASAAKNAAAAIIYPKQAVQVQAKVDESDLPLIHIGQDVTINFDWDADEKETMDGVITDISSVANAGDKVTYTIYVDFKPETDVKFGMSVTVGIPDEDGYSSGSESNDDLTGTSDTKSDLSGIGRDSAGESDGAQKAAKTEKPSYEGAEEEESGND